MSRNVTTMQAQSTQAIRGTHVIVALVTRTNPTAPQRPAKRPAESRTVPSSSARLVPARIELPIRPRVCAAFAPNDTYIMRAMKTLLKPFGQVTARQDLMEYSLLLAFVAFAAAALLQC